MNTSYTGKVMSDYFRSPTYRTEDLMADYEFYSNEYAHHKDSDPTEVKLPSIEFCSWKQDAILDELSRRKRLADRFADDPRGPQWPNRDDKRYQDLLSLAADLKQDWPIDRFMSELMGCTLIQSGSVRMRCSCPLPGHSDDKSPSFVIYLSQQRFHCYGCGRGGDVFDLTGIYFGIDSFPERVKKLAEGSIHRDRLVAS